MATRRYRRRRNTGALLVNPRRRRRTRRKRNSARSILSRLRRRKRTPSKSRKRSIAAKKAAATRRRNATRRSNAAKRAAATRRRRNTRKGGYRKTARRAYMRTPSRRRRRSTRKGMRRKTARRAYTRRRNTGVITGIQSSLKKVPVVGGMLADIVGLGTPAAFGAVSILPIEMGLKAGGRYLPARLQAVSFTIGGLLMGALAKKFLPAGKFRDQISVALATAGGAVDFYRWRQGQTTVESMEVAEVAATSGYGALEVMNGYGSLEVMSGYGGGHHHHGYGELEVMAGYGDMGYDVVNFSQAGAGTSLGAYLSDASMMDAYYSGSDFGAAERTAALAGPRKFMRRFPGGRKRLRRIRQSGSQHSQPSQNAGRPGCGKKWMICLVGFDNFQKIAALPRNERRQVIKSLRRQAISMLPDLLSSTDAEDSDPAMDSDADWGALMYAGAY